MEVVSNPGTQYRVRMGILGVDYTELHLDVVGLAELDTATLGPDAPVYTYADVTDDVLGINITRGRARTTDTHRAGSCVIRLLDRQRYYDAENTSSPYYGQIVKGRSVLVEFRKTGPTWHYLFAGNIDRIAYTMQPGPTGYQIAEISATDALATLARQALQTAQTFSAELTGTRISNLLAQAGTMEYGQSLAAGTVTAVATTNAAGSTILNLVQEAATAEGGEFYAAADGTLTFAQRYANYNPVSAYTLTPDNGSATYRSIQIETAAEVYPQINVDDENGITRTARNSYSFLTYTGTLTPDAGALLSAADAQSLADYLLAIYGTPTTNVRLVDVPVVQQIEAHIHDLLLTDLGDAVQVERQFLVGTPAALTEWYGVESISHTIDRGHHNMLIGLGSKTSAGWLQLDSTAFGTLDTNALA